MWWLCLIPVLILGLIALNAHQSGKELKEDIEKYKLTKKWL
ncbi:hypothetical protein ES705_17675 [subsurface metagenome]